MSFGPNKYTRFVDLKNKKFQMVPSSSVSLYQDPKYESVFASLSYYTQEHVNHFNKEKSVQGITGLKTDKIWFDLDSKSDLELSRKDTLEIVKRLKEKNVNEDSIELYFSGSKGFHVILTLDKDIPTKNVGKMAENFIGDLKTFDTQVYDEARIFRVPYTQHEKSGLYKIPLTVEELNTLSIDQIKEKAKTPDVSLKKSKKNKVSYTDNLFSFKEDVKPVEVKKLEVNANDKLRMKELDFTRKPPGWKDYKWALAQGRFEIGTRHNSMLIVAATYKAMYYTRDQTEAMCEIADKIHCEITHDTPMNDLDTVLDSVYSPNWQGGQGSKDSSIFLSQYCKQNGFEQEVIMEKTLSINESVLAYKKFAETAKKFKVNTGIACLDNKTEMTVGTVNAILAGPGVGKTSLAIQILNAMSRSGQRSIFYSYDMYLPLVIRKLIQRHKGLTNGEIETQVDEWIKPGNKYVEEILEKEYDKISFCVESGQSCDDIVKTLQRERERYNEDISLIVIDYNELIKSSQSDSTEATKEIAMQLRNIANIYNVCIILLIQPNKMAGGPADEIKNYRSMKGSSMNEQVMDLILGLSRPGYDGSNNYQNDKFLTINAVKNRHGSPFKIDLLWDGLTGTISEGLDGEDRLLLTELRDRKKAETSNSGF